MRSLKSVEPQTGLTAEFPSQAGRAAAADGWLPVAAMPAMVHDALLAHGKIEEPWLPGGTAKCFWVGGLDWVYALRSDARPGRASRMHFLGLEGRTELPPRPSEEVCLNGLMLC